jgi:hypothetical protein
MNCEQKLKAMDAGFYFVWVKCRNCGYDSIGNEYGIKKGQKVEETECKICGCKSLYKA